MADLNRGQTPGEKHRENAAQLAELNEAIRRQTEEAKKRQEEEVAKVEETETLADKEIAAVIGNAEGYAPYDTPDWYEQEYVKRLPPPLRKLVSPKAREELEKSLPSIDVGDILLAQASQVVPVIRGSLNVTYRVLTTEEEICVEDMIADGPAMSQKQALSSINVYRLAISVTAIGDDRLPEHRTKDGNINKAVIEKKIERIKKQANPITVLMTQHLGWFDRRVYSALAGESLKNG